MQALPAGIVAPRLRRSRCSGAGFVLGVVVRRGVGSMSVMARVMAARVVNRLVVRMMLVMVLRGKGWGCEDHQHQDSGKNLFHGTNVAQEGRERKRNERPEPKEEREGPGAPSKLKQRKLKA